MRFYVLLLVLLTGCGGGGDESGVANTPVQASFILNKPSIQMKTQKAFFSLVSSADDKLVITTKETNLTAGMPAGEKKPDWLYFTLKRHTDNLFHLEVSADTTIESMKSDVYTSTIRVGSVNSDGSFAKYIDIPVTFDLIDFVSFAPNEEQKLNGRSGALQQSSVDYAIRTTAKDWQVTTDASWLSAGAATQNFPVYNFKIHAVAEKLQPGKHTANLIFKSTDGRTVVKHPVSFHVEKQRWWLARYAVGLSQLGLDKHLAAAIPVNSHDPKLFESLQSSSDAGWLKTQLIDNKLQLNADTSGLPTGMHYAKVKISDPKNSADDKTVWVGLFISETATAVANIDLKVPSGKRTISRFLADPIRPFVYVQLSEPSPQLRAYHLISGEMLWQLELGDFTLKEISSDGQHVVLTKSAYNDCQLVQLSLATPPAADWTPLAKKYPSNGCIIQSKIQQVDGSMVNSDGRSLHLADAKTFLFHLNALTRLDENDYGADLLNFSRHAVRQIMLSPLNDLSVVLSNSGGLNWATRVTLFSTMVLPDQQQVRYFELAHLDNIRINEGFYAPVTNRLWLGNAYVDLQNGKMALTGLNQHCTACWMYNNMGVERSDGRVAIIGQTFLTETSNTGYRLMIFDHNALIQSGSATNSDWQYDARFGTNGIRLSADEQWLLIGSSDLIEVRRF